MTVANSLASNATRLETMYAILATTDDFLNESEFLDKVRMDYLISKNAKTGETCSCPSCGKKFVKKSSRQAFCGDKRCSQLYHNATNPDRRKKSRGYCYMTRQSRR